MPITESQKEKRLKYLGASEIAAVLGEDPWTSAWDVWAKRKFKLRPEPKREPGSGIDVGNYCEGGMLDYVADTFEVTVVSNQFYVADNGVQSCHCDGIVVETGCRVLSPKRPWVVEAKSTGDFGDYSDGEPPPWVLYQVQQQMQCSGATAAIVVALTPSPGRGPLQFTTYFIERDDGMISNMEEYALAWWDRHIVGEEIPTMEDCTPTTKRILSSVVSTEVVVEGGEYEHHAYEMYRAALKSRGSNDDEAEYWRTILKASAEDAGILELPGAGKEIVFQDTPTVTFGKNPKKHTEEICSSCGVGHSETTSRKMRERNLRNR